jgi:peptidyl-prolyl cis-trans isomerase C
MDAMKVLTLFAILCLGAAWAQPQTPPAAPAIPDPPDNAVVVVFDDGAKLTMAEFRALISAMPQQNQQMALANRGAFLSQWGLARRLARMAEEDKLDQQSPIKDILNYNRTSLLAQTKLERVSFTLQIGPEDTERYYEAHKDAYKQVKVKAIYVAFGDGGAAGKPALTEEQAKTKAAKLLQQIKAGADFTKLVKENSDDASSREKDGDFGVMKPSDAMDETLRSVIFSLKKGETSEPLKQPNGFYLLRADDVTSRPLAEVRDEIFQRVRDEKTASWLKEQSEKSAPKFPDLSFLGQGVTVPLNIPAPPAPLNK